MLRQAFARLLVGLSLLLSLLLLGACGGGGGGGGGGGNSGGGGGDNGGAAAPSIITTQAQITRSNGKEFAATLSDLASLSDEVIEAVPPLFSGSGSILLISSNRQQNGNTLIDFSVPCISGSVRYNGSFSSATGIGELTITHSNCNQGSGLTTNGSVVIRVRDTDSSRTPVAYDWTFNAYRQALTGTSEALTFYGSTAVDPAGVDTRAQNDFSVRSSSGVYIQAQALVALYVQGAYSWTSPLSAQRSGRIAYSDWGYVDVSTTISGYAMRHFLAGSQQSQLRIELPSGNALNLALDADGDSRYEAFLRGSVEGFVDADGSAPAAPTLSLPTWPIDATANTRVGIDISTVYDINYDFIDFAVAVVSTPLDVPIDLQLDETVAEFDVTAGGDYVIAVTANDGTGRSVTQSFTVRVPLPAPDLSQVTNTIHTAQVGSPLVIDVVPANADSLPVTYQLLESPAGLTIDSNGRIEWTPASINPYFHAEEYVVRLQVGNTNHNREINLTLLLEENVGDIPLVRSAYFLPSRDGGMHVGDFDGSGKPELLITDNNRLVYTLEESGGTYLQNWVFPYSPCHSEIEALAPLATSVAGKREIAVLCSDGDIAVIAAEGGRVLRRGSVDAFLPAVDYEIDTTGVAMTAGDLDGDGHEELVVIGDWHATKHVLVFDAQMLQPKGFAAVDSHTSQLALGNVDNDTQLEIVTNDGLVIDGVSYEVEWDFNWSSYGIAIVLGDVDGDGIQEIVARRSWQPLAIYSAVLRSQRWELSGATDICGLTVAQLDGDVALELITGPCQWGDVIAYDLVGGVFQQKWSVSAQHHGASNLLSGDVDGDGDLDVAWVTGASISDGSSLAIADAQSQAVLFHDRSFRREDGAYTGAYTLPRPVGDPLALFATPQSGSGYGGAHLQQVDIASGEVVATPELASNWGNSVDVCLTDSDQDGWPEVLVSAFETYDPVFLTFDPPSMTVESSLTLIYNGGSTAALTCVDLNGDGRDEAVRANSQKLLVQDMAASNTLWDGFTLNGLVADVAHADLDGDGDNELLAVTENELVAYTTGGGVYVEFGRYSFNSGYYEYGFSPQILVTDTDGSGRPEIVLSQGSSSGRSDTTLVVLDHLLGVRRQISVEGRVSALGAADVGRVLIGIEDGDYLSLGWRVAQLDLQSGQRDWQSPLLVGRVTGGALNRAPAEGSLPDRLQFGTSSAMYITR